MDNCKVEIQLLGESTWNKAKGEWVENLLNDKDNPINEMTAQDLEDTCAEATFVKIFITGHKAESVASTKGQSFLAKYLSHFNGIVDSKAMKNGWCMMQSAKVTRNDFDVIDSLMAQ